MKRAGDLFYAIIDFDNLLEAFHKAQLGKADREGVKIFRAGLNDNIASLRSAIIDDTLVLGNYRYFTVHDPKTRLICAADFPERVVHHALINVIGTFLERRMIYHSYACRKGKGQHQALETARCFSRNHRFYLKTDIKKCFDSIPHTGLMSMLSRLFKDCRLLLLCKKIIDSYHVEPGHGLPIGNLTSQYFANAYLDIFDHWIEERCRVMCYLRYMDDMLVFGEKNDLVVIREKCKDYLVSELGLSLNKGGMINRTEAGVGFLGRTVFPNGIRLSKRTKKRVRTKFHRYETMWDKGYWDSATLQRRMESLWAGMKTSNSLGWRRRLAERACNDV